MKFYTSVQIRGNNILEIGYEDGERFENKVEFSPTLYVPYKKPSEWTTMFGQYVEPIQPGTIQETRNFLKKYEDVSGFDYYGNTNYVIQYISDNYPSEIKWDISQIRVFNIDIETKVDHGFPYPETALEEILLITLRDSYTGLFHTFASHEFENKENITIYSQADDEIGLIKNFLSFWKNNYPDVMTGWNIKGFDIPYLVNRINNIMGDYYTKMLSPWGVIKENKGRDAYNKETIVYELLGINTLDYIDLYKKFTYVGRESYKLDYIAEVELGEKKLENPYNSFKEFYQNDFNRFTEYNIHDVRLVAMLEDKLQLITLALTLSYEAKINYDDVYKATRLWDAIIYNHLKAKNIVIPKKNYDIEHVGYPGAYVKHPITGFHKWILSIDATSLYPSIIQMLNISPETIRSDITGVTVDSLLDESCARFPENVSVAASGTSFDISKKSIFGEILDHFLQKRKEAKNEMLKYEGILASLDKNSPDRSKIESLVSTYNNKQMGYKIAVNSLYGACGEQNFRYFDVRIATAITLTGQFILKYVENTLNSYLNKMLDTRECEYVIYMDTDSVLFNLNILVEKYYKNISHDKIVDILDKIYQQKIAPIVDNSCNILSEKLNAFRNTIYFKRETICDVGIFVAKKFYILSVYNSEGVSYNPPKIKIKGLASVRSSTPAVVRQKLKDVIPILLAGQELELHKFVSDFKAEFITLKVDQIASPRKVSGLSKYGSADIYKKATPIQTRASLLYNNYIKSYKLENKYHMANDGDKIKFVYLKSPNPIRENVIAFPDTLPEEFGLRKYIDYEKQFEVTFIKPLESIITYLGWTVNRQSSLADFFG